MLTQIQKRSEEKQDAISWLLACHQRIRHFTALAKRLSLATDARGDEVREVAESVHRYFTVALPLHEQDEERSLLPRLMGKDPALDQALVQMQKEHREINASINLLLKTLTTLIQDPAQLKKISSELQTLADKLDALWQPHLSKEETFIFSAAERLSLAEKEALRAEMKERRA